MERPGTVALYPWLWAGWVGALVILEVYAVRRHPGGTLSAITRAVVLPSPRRRWVTRSVWVAFAVWFTDHIWG